MKLNSRTQARIYFGKKYWYALILIFLVLMVGGSLYYYSPWLVESQWFSFKDFDYNLSDCDTRKSSSEFQPSAIFYTQNHILYFRYLILSNCATDDTNYHLSYHQYENEIIITGYLNSTLLAACICPFEVSGHIKGLNPGIYTIYVYDENKLVYTYYIVI